MTMPRGVSRALYSGNGQAVDFPFLFKVFEEDQLSVLVTSPEGVTTEATGWSAQLDDGGGTLTYLHNGAPLPEGWKLAIVRDMPFVQEVDLITGTRFDPEVIETALDVATAERQQLLERLARAVVVEPTDEAGPEALLADIRDARTSAAASATSAQANANAAAESARSAAGSAAVATEAREAACICAEEARAARDVALAQTEAANTLMEAELAKVNAIVAVNRTDQQAAVTAARQWAEKAPDPPVDDDAEGQPRYSARHWAENAQKIAIEPPTAERRGSIRVGAGLHLEAGENGEKDVLAVSLAELGGQLLLNSEEWITESGTWTAKSTGWHELFLISGGAGALAQNRTTHMVICGGWSGDYKTFLIYLTEGQQVPVIIGAGGLGANETTTVRSGGRTSFGDYSTVSCEEEDWQGFPAALFNIPISSNGVQGVLMPGTGFGSNNYSQWPSFYGAGGDARTSGDGTIHECTNGKQGAIRVRRHDPAKANGPLPTPALLSARSVASRAAAPPATVNLYDPETGQGSVWNEADVEAKLAEGLVREEAWLETCAARAAEEYAAWLADPETEEERFSLLQQACAAKLTETDKYTMSDYPVSDETRAEVDAYRKAIRQLNHQPGAPWDGGGELTPWPEMPTVSKVQGA